MKVSILFVNGGGSRPEKGNQLKRTQGEGQHPMWIFSNAIINEEAVNGRGQAV